MNTLARMYVWWPNMNADVEDTVKKCHLCQSNRASPPPAPLHPWEWPTQPWTRLHLDMAGPFMGHMFFILIDAHSKWIEVELMSSTTSSAIISILRKIFARFGLPTTIVTDNGRNFVSSEFNEFLHRNGIKHLMSAPYHPSSNGLAERAVQTFKTNISKLTSGSLADKISTFLFHNHLTPQSTTGLSPAELLQNRRLRSRLDLIKPDLNAKVEHKQTLQKNYHDDHSRSQKFKMGDLVYARNFRQGEKWYAGHIVEITGPVSFLIELSDGRTIRRQGSSMIWKHKIYLQ